MTNAHDDHVLNLGNLNGYTYHDLGDGIRFNTRTTPQGEAVVDGNAWRVPMTDPRFRFVDHGPSTFGHIETFYVG